MKIAIAAFTDRGNSLANKIIQFKDDKYVIFDKTKHSIKDWLKEVFFDCEAIIFIGATGIATRLIAKLLDSKDKDPAVIVIDEFARFVIPLLSGHIGGANSLALKLADYLAATPVITTATDLNKKFAVDVWSSSCGCIIEDKDKIKIISSRILKDEQIAFCSDFSGSGKLPNQLYVADSGSVGICLSLDIVKKPFDDTLKVIPKILTLGIGCRRNTAFVDLEKFILQTLTYNNLSIKAVKNIATIDLKADEECILQFAAKYKLDFITFTSEQLQEVKGDFTSSQFVQRITGVDNVCERSALLQSKGELLIKKTAKEGMTFAVAQANWQYCF